MSVPTGGAPSPTPATGQGAAPVEGQPPAGSQALNQGAAQPSSGFNWGLFPDVPEDQRPNLEPHLKNVQGHVTRLEQQYAPFKPLLDQGVDPQQVQGLMGFAQQLQQDPVQTWLRMAQQFQQQGLMSELDYEALVEAATGTATDDGSTDEMPPWAQQMMQTQQQMQERIEREQQQRQSTIQEALLKRSVAKATEDLKSAGVVLPEGDEGERIIISSIIANNGNAQAAVQSIVNWRQANLQGLTESNQPGQQEGDKSLMPRGAPPSPSRTQPGEQRRGRDPEFAAADEAAMQMLNRNNAEAAQGG